MLEHTHVAGPKQWSSEPGRGETRRARAAKHTFASVESRTINGSALLRLPDGEALIRPQTELMAQSWHAGKKKNLVRKSRLTRQTSTAIQADRGLDDLDEKIQRRRGRCSKSAGRVSGSPIGRGRANTAIYRRPGRFWVYRRIYHGSHQRGPGDGSIPRDGAGPRPTVRQPPQWGRAFTSELGKALRRRKTFTNA